MLYTVCKEFEISCAHRIVNHTGNCSRVHGHNYRIKIDVSSRVLNGLGVVCDFADIDTYIIQRVKDKMDHMFLMWEKDPMLKKMEDTIYSSVSIFDFNVTAENMCRYIAAVSNAHCHDPHSLNDNHLFVSKVEIWETGKCSASYSTGGETCMEDVFEDETVELKKGANVKIGTDKQPTHWMPMFCACDSCSCRDILVSMSDANTITAKCAKCGAGCSIPYNGEPFLVALTQIILAWNDVEVDN